MSADLKRFGRDERGASAQAKTWEDRDLSAPLLAGAIDYAFNPAYPDGSDDACMFDAILKAMRFIEDQPCQCVAGGDQCARCAALGRCQDIREER